MRKLQRIDDSNQPWKNMTTSRFILSKAARKTRFVTKVHVLEEQT